MLPFVSVSSPTNWEELICCSFWWHPEGQIEEYGFSPARAASLHKCSLKRYSDIWCVGRFLSPPEAQEKFNLLPVELPIWAEVVIRLHRRWRNLLRSSSRKINCGEWLAIFGDTAGSMPIVVCKVVEGFQPEVGAGSVKIPRSTQLFSVKQSSMTLEETSGDSLNLPALWDDLGNDTVQLCYGAIHKVRVLEATKGPKKTTIW